MSQPGGSGADAHEALQKTITLGHILVNSTLIKREIFPTPSCYNRPDSRSLPHRPERKEPQ
jgi:hypothetical protein